MGWVVWAVAGAAALLLIDWFIVMGLNPKEWKGGRRDDQYR